MDNIMQPLSLDSTPVDDNLFDPMEDFIASAEPLITDVVTKPLVEDTVTQQPEVEVEADVSENKPHEISEDLVYTDKSEKKEEKVVVYTNPNVTMQSEPRRPLKDNDARTPVGIISDQTFDEFVQTSRTKAFKDAVDSLEEEQELRSINDGAMLLHKEGLFEKALEKDSNYVQRIEFEDTRLEPRIPRLGATKSGDVLTGAKALAKMQTTLKHGSFIKFPCWASGVWITLRAPTTIELANYYDLVSNEIIELGKKTSGGIFGATQVHFIKHLFDLAQKLLQGWTVKDENKRLQDVLVVDDIETIAWAIATCMYPNGYPFQEVCTANPEECMHVHNELINISKLFWVDEKRITKFQRSFMKQDNLTRSADELLNYQLNGDWGSSEHTEFDGFKLIMKTPTVDEYIKAGYKWIDSLEDSVREIIYDVDDKKLNDLVLERAGLTIVREYSPFIRGIIFSDGSVINKREDIDSNLNEISSDVDISKMISDAVNEHIVKNNISMVAINRHKCVKCGSDMNPEEKSHPFLVPLSALQLFFFLRDRKLQLE